MTATLPTTLRRTTTVTVGALLTGAALLPLVKVLNTAPALRLIALSVPAATVVTLGAQRLVAGRQSPDRPGPRGPLAVAVALFLGVMAGVLPGMFLAAADPYAPSGLGSRLAGAVADGVQRLLSVPTPVPDSRGFTDLPLLVGALLAAVVALAARSQRPVGALVPATLVFGGLLTLGVHGPGSSAVYASCYAVAALGYLAATSSNALRDSGLAAFTTAAVAVAAFVGVTAIPLHKAFDPRSVQQLPVQSQVSVDPLAELSGRLQSPDRPVLTATLSGALQVHPRNWVSLVYDSYDGAAWRASADAKPTGIGTVPVTGDTGAAQVTLTSPATLLPHPGNVSSNRPGTVEYDSGHELLASAGALGTFSVTASVVNPGADALTSAAIPANAPAGLTAVPSCAPPGLRSLADQARQQASLPDEEAVWLQEHLNSAPYVYDKKAPPGESCGNITRFLQTQRGTSAQFATAFVMAARQLGLPARMAVGYLPGHTAGATDVVTDGDAYAWPQVMFGGIGWVDFDPTPRSDQSAAAPPREQQTGVSQVSQAVDQGHRTKDTTTITDPPKPRHRGPSVALVVVLGALGFLALVAIWLGVVRIRLLTRRRRLRRAPEAAARVVGAWDELLHPLEQAGLTVRARSSHDVAAAAVGVVPESVPVRRLAVLVERALYDEVSMDDADVAWQLSDSARKSVGTTLSAPQRVRSAFRVPADRR
ncbi:transglutaminase-like putative cysteine protease/FtsH-binding integral membrane protein [Catenulispora sp. GAS73]|uniref:transglutaminase-like domain-containing protein n=1 Tax=Catenulispora sp. GAS73 TaxID=3156269 RepID=UPI003516F414